jgi:hypothetical protein
MAPDVPDARSEALYFDPNGPGMGLDGIDFNNLNFDLVLGSNVSTADRQPEEDLAEASSTGMNTAPQAYFDKDYIPILENESLDMAGLSGAS